ncbi:MAG: SpoIIE family protein phosphatase [Microthrixaceae bacterium]|nr:SpoIIE family protein phosphatase [Microthrixaceae bacterium]
MTQRPIDDFAADEHADPAVVDSLPRAVVVTSRENRIVRWNRAANEVFGWTEDEALGRPAVEMLVPATELDSIDDAIARVRGGATWTGDLTLVHRDGRALDVRVSNSPLTNDAGEIVGVVWVSEDVSQQRLLERERADLAEQLRVALDVGGLGTWRWDRATGRTEWDPMLQELYGLPDGSTSGTRSEWHAALHPDDQAVVLAAFDRALENGSSFHVEHRVARPDGSVRWLQGRGQMVLNGDGEVTGAIGCTSDITERVELDSEREQVALASQAAAESERLTRERLEFLGTISEALSQSTTHREVMHNVSNAAVPRLGDWCIISVLRDESSREPEHYVAHVDSKAREFANSINARFPYDADSDMMLPTIIRTGKTQFYPVLDTELVDASPHPDQSRQMVEGLSLRSVIGVALAKGERVLGAMQFVNSTGSRTFTEDDVVLAEVVASRVAAALDDLRLREEEQLIARTLQAALLPTDLPHIVGADLAVRYWATGEATEVGGDFYDVFDLDDRWAVVMGDVCGTGPVAAATTGLARHTIRASAWHGAGPSEVLAELNGAMLRSGRTTFCTVSYSTITPLPDGTGFELECVSGGHPLPVLCRSSGEVMAVGTPGTLVGMLSAVTHSATRVTLSAGDTLVLYTDGVTDVRPPDDLTSAELAELVRVSCAGATTADEVADRLRDGVEAVLPLSERHDDIALLVLRVT